MAPKPAPVGLVGDDDNLQSPDLPGKRAGSLDVNTVMRAGPHFATQARFLGGYLRGMADQAGAGELHLERSFHGRLSGQAA